MLGAQCALGLSRGCAGSLATNQRDRRIRTLRNDAPLTPFLAVLLRYASYEAPMSIMVLPSHRLDQGSIFADG